MSNYGSSWGPPCVWRRWQVLGQLLETSYLAKASILKQQKHVLCDIPKVIPWWACHWYEGQVHFHRTGSVVNIENPGGQWETFRICFPHSNQGSLIKFIRAFIFFLRKKNVNVLPICPGRINLHSHLKGLTTLFSLCRAGWVPCPGFLKRPSPSWQFPGLPLQWTWSKGKENRAAEPRGIKLKQQICFLASLLNTFRVFKAPKGNALGPWMWEAHLNPFPRGNLSPRWGKLAH